MQAWGEHVHSRNQSHSNSEPSCCCTAVLTAASTCQKLVRESFQPFFFLWPKAAFLIGWENLSRPVLMPWLYLPDDGHLEDWHLLVPLEYVKLVNIWLTLFSCHTFSCCILHSSLLVWVTDTKFHQQQQIWNTTQKKAHQDLRPLLILDWCTSGQSKKLFSQWKSFLQLHRDVLSQMDVHTEDPIAPAVHATLTHLECGAYRACSLGIWAQLLIPSFLTDCYQASQHLSAPGSWNFLSG